MIRQLFHNEKVKRACVLIVLIGILFFPTMQKMYETWMEDSNNSHGVLVPFIVVYLLREAFLRKKDAVSGALDAKPTRAYLGLVGLAFSLCFYFVSTIIDIVVFKNIAFLGAVYSSLLFVFGLSLCRLFWFPLLFLVFMVPVPTTLYGMVALPMQLFATKVTVFLLSATPLPVVAEGNIIRVGSEMLTVAEACSGLRSLMSFIMISLLFAYLARIRRIKKIAMVCCSIPIAVCGNILRLLFTTGIAYLYGTRVATGFIHDVSGYVMFVLAFAVFFFLARTFEDGLRKTVL